MLPGDLELDGSKSVDTANENIPFEWQWICYTLQNVPLDENQCKQQKFPCKKPNGENFNLPNEKKIHIPQEWLSNGDYYFILIASKEERSDFDEILITILPDSSSWNAWILSPCDYRYGEKLIIEGHCDDGDSNDDDEHLDSYLWQSSISIDSTTSTTLSTNKFLVLDPYAMSPYSTYPNIVVLVCNNEQCKFLAFFFFINNSRANVSKYTDLLYNFELVLSHYQSSFYFPLIRFRFIFILTN